MALPGSAGASEVVVEINSAARLLVKPQPTRRLIALELADVDVPESLTLPAAGGPSSLFFRVRAVEEDTLTVELWERGEFHGSRRIPAVRGTAQLRARRVALAAAALARRLRRKRLADAHLAAARKDEIPSRVVASGFPLYGHFAVGAAVNGVGVGPGDLWLAGPALAAQLRFDSGARLELGSSWLVGSTAERAGTTSAARWLEASLTPAVAVPLSSALALDVGASAALAAVHLSGARSVDGVTGELDTWSARVAGRLRLEGTSGRLMRWMAGPEAGVVARRIVTVDADGHRRRLGGVWLGLAMGFVVDPHPGPVGPKRAKAATAKELPARRSEQQR